jgi:hypothetical protein
MCSLSTRKFTSHEIRRFTILLIGCLVGGTLLLNGSRQIAVIALAKLARARLLVSVSKTRWRAEWFFFRRRKRI